MATPNTHSSPPVDLLERPRRISRIHLGKPRSNKLGSSISERPDTGIAAFAPSTFCTNVVAGPHPLTPSASTMAIQHYMDCARIAPQSNNTASSASRRNPMPSSTRHNFKDPLVERFERLKLPPHGKLQPEPRLFAPAVSPLSPSGMTLTAGPQVPIGSSFTPSGSTSDEMLTVRLFETMEHVPIS
jgi:hypothetical protein